LQGEVEAISMMPPKGKTNEKGESIEEGMLEYAAAPLPPSIPLHYCCGQPVLFDALGEGGATMRTQPAVSPHDATASLQPRPHLMHGSLHSKVDLLLLLLLLRVW
jgi:hypothetical protein